jgi:hypothetical protein
MKLKNSRLLWICGAGSVLTLLTACPAAVPGQSTIGTGAASSSGATGQTGATGSAGAAGANGAAGINIPAASSNSSSAPAASPSSGAAPSSAGTTAAQSAPTLTGTSPSNGSTGVAINRPISATFSKAMDPATLNASTFTLSGAGSTINGSITYNASSNTATFTPASNLATNTSYTALLSTGIKDTSGLAASTTFGWNFMTGATVGENPVALSQTLSNFAVLAGSTVTNSGQTVVNGDLGVSPGTQIVGFDVPGGPGSVNGTRHAGDSIAAQAKADLTTSYKDAASRSGAPISEAGNIGGMTLAPGLYNSQTSLAISSGDLTLDAKGDANAVWVFQMGSTLTTTSGRQVILSGGAKANNVYWQVGSSATLGTTSVFKGNILAAISITMNTGASLEGRALTQSGAVALNANTVTKPSP